MSYFSPMWFVSLETTGRLGSCCWLAFLPSPPPPAGGLLSPALPGTTSAIEGQGRDSGGRGGQGWSTGLGLGPAFATDKVLGDLS